MKQTVESRTAEAILQKPQQITICSETYQAAPPSIATLILVSEAVAEMPNIRLDTENIVTESLYIAKDCRVLGDIIAILILGATNLCSTKIIETKHLFGLITKHKEVTVDNKAALAKKILEKLSPREISEMFTKLMSGMELAFFFGITTSLTEINLLRQTRNAKTTASGQ